MNKVKTSLSYIVLVLLAIVIIASCLFLGLNNSQTQNVGVNDNLVTTSTGSIYSSSFDYLEDGSVPSGYTSNYTNIYTGGGLSGSTNYKMTSDAEFRMIGSTDKWTTGACDTSTNNYPEYSGTLDGCGHTLTINVEYKNNSESGSTCYAGFLTGLLSGTIKNLTIRVNFYWRRGKSNSAAIKGDSSFYIGAVCGAITGTLQNVKIIINYDGTGFTASDSQGITDLAHIYYWNAAVFISPVAGKAKGATFKNVTVDVATNVTILTHKNSGWGGDNNYSFFGYLAGASEGTTNFINTTIRTTDGNVKQVIISDGGTVTDRLGLYVGKIEGGTTTFNGVDFGELNITNSSFNSAGYFTGECKDASNISVTNVYYRNTTNNAMQNNKYWSVGTNESYGTISNKILYNNIPESQFGFLKSDSNNNTLWIYCPNSGFAESGTFVKSITIGNSSTSLYREASLRKEDGYYKFTKPTAGPISRETGTYRIWEISSNTAGKTYDTVNVTLNNIITEIKHSSTSKVFPDSGTFFNDTGDYIKSKSDFFSLAVPNNSDYAQVGTYTVTPQNIYSYGWTVDSGSNVYLFKDVSSSYSYTVNKAESILTTPQLYDGGVAEDWMSQVWKTKKSAEEYEIDNRNEARFVYLTYVRTYDDLKEVTLDSSINIQVGKLNGPNYTVTPTLAKGAIQQSGTNGKGQTFDNATYDGENQCIIKHVFKKSSTDDSGSIYEVDYIFNGDVNLYSSYVKCYVTINPNNKNYNSETQDPLEYNGTAYNIKEMHNIPTSVTYTYLGPDTQKDLGESAPSNVGNYRVNVVEGKDATNYDYQIEASSFTYSIYPKQLTITPYKEYDGTQNSTSNYNIVGIVNGDDINTTFAGTYNSTGVGLDKTFTLNSSLIESKTFANTPYVCLKGNNNYCVVSQDLPNSVIYPKLVSFECFQKQYDGNNNAFNIENNNVKTASGFVGSDNVTTLKLTGYFGSNDANGSEDVGTNKSFTFYRQGYSANNRGFDTSTYNAYIGGNYWIPGTNYRISVYTYVYDNCIYPAEITISSISKIYDGKNTFDTSNISFSGIKVSSDTSDLNGKINGTFASSNVGTHAITFDNSKLNNTTYSYYVENGLMGAGYYINGSNFYISNNTYSNTTGTITKATITATLNDTKQLYDSRLDVIYSNNVYNYDFIYNYTGSAVTLSDTWIDYTQIFNLSAPSITGFTDMGYKIVGFKYYSSSTSTTEITNTVGSSSTETIYYIGIEIGNDNQAALENINTIIRVVNTTGAANDYSLTYGSTTYAIGESAKTNVPIRLIIAANKVVNGTTTSDDSLNNWNQANAYENSGLWNFINSRYYDSTSFYGKTITQKATEYTFGENITYNAPVNVYTILPAYRTINGNGNSYLATWNGSATESYETFGVRSGNTNTTAATTNKSIIPAYASISNGMDDLGVWNGASELIALNYGTIKNLTVSLNITTSSAHEYSGFTDTNTAYGFVTGINFGRVEQVAFTTSTIPHTQIRHSNKGVVSDSMGSIAGINLGTIVGATSYTTSTLQANYLMIHTHNDGYALNAYIGGLVGINFFGNISNYAVKYLNSMRLYAGASGLAVAGGIVGYNYGPGANNTNYSGGQIYNVRVETGANTNIFAGSLDTLSDIGLDGSIHSINLTSFASGGAVGVNNGGELEKVTVINSGKIRGGSNTTLSALSYVGGLVGVGCETNTYSSAITYYKTATVTQTIRPGLMKTCNIINYGTIQAYDSDTLTNGKYGIVAGTYANVTNISKAFEGIIWYTSTNGTIYIYGQGGVLGHNPTQSATVSNITGLMGLDFVDGYKSFVAKEFMDSNSNIELLTKNGYEMIKIKYSAVPITNFVSGYVTVVDKNTGKEYAANPSGLDYSTSSLNIIAKNSSGEVLAGEAYIAIADLDAITTSNEAGRAKIWFKYIVDDITTTDVDISHGNDVDAASSKTRYLDFLNSKDDTLTGTRRYYQGASTFNLKNNINADIKPLDFVLNEKKVFNGNNKTITIKWGSGNLTDGSYYANDTLYHNIKSKYTGSLVAVNKGQVINLNMTITGSNSYYLISEGDATYSLSVGIIAGYNSGYIANCTVNFVENKYAGMRAWSSRTYHLFGGITGINHNGTIDNCIVNINGEVKIDDNGSTNGWNAIGGVAGTTDGGFIYGTKVNITSTGKLIGYAYNACFVGGLVGFMMTNKGSNINDNADNFGGISTNPTIIECSQVINAGTITATHNQASTALGIGVIAGEIFNSSSTTTNNDSFKNVYAISRYNAVNYGNSSAGLTIVGFNKWTTPQTPIELKGITFISLKDVVGNNSVGDLVSSISTVNGNNITASNNKSYAMPNNVTFNLSNSSVIFGDNKSGTEFKMVEVNDIERTENCSINASNSVGTQTTTANYSFTFTPDSTSGLAKVIVPIYYTVQFTETDISYKTANTALNSPILNFLGGFGNLPIYQGAKKGVLQNNITIDKNGTGGRKLAQGKIFDGGGHIITAYMSQGNNETLQYEGYGSDNAAGVKSTPGGTNYVSYEYGNSSYKAGGELVAINYGTMRNFTLSLESYYWFRRYQCINADSAYGMVCGINAGTITNVVVDHTRDYHLVTNASTKVFVGEVAGMNFGTISNTQVSLTAELSIKGSATNVVVGGIAGANINGSITYCKLTSSEAYRYAKEYTTTEVVIENKYYLGILSVDSGITYAVIGGLIGINSNATAKYLIIDSIEKSEFISLATSITYFAAGIAVSDNTKNDAVGKNYNGVPLTVYPSVDGDNAKVGYIYLNFESQLRYKSTTNYIGVAFAKAAQYASTTYGDTQGAVYQGIFISPNFVEDVPQYVISTDGAIALADGIRTINNYDSNGNLTSTETEIIPAYISISSGFSVMGYFDNFSIATGVGKNIRTGARIDANEKINCTWDDGNLVIAPKNNEEVIRLNTVSITNIDEDKQTTAYSFTNTDKLTGQLTISTNNDKFSGNFNQTTTHKVYVNSSAISNLKRLDSYSVSQSSVGEYTIYVEYFQPIVTISNVFQLAQFMFYDPSASAANVQNWFYETFINGKTSNGVSYATMMGVTNSDMATSTDAVFYDSSVGIRYWQAKRAKLADNIDNIVLDKFTYQGVEYTVDLGWNHQRYFTFAENKTLDGNGKKITIVVEDFDTVTKGSLPSTSQFYVSGSGDYASEIAVSETNTPAQKRKMFLAGGFIGLQRGTLKNINFVYREGSEFTIAKINSDNTLSRLEMSNCLFVGVVSGYQTGTTDSCTLTLEKDTQVYISKYADKVEDNPYYSNSFLGGYAGFIANGAVISNSKLTMLDNATLGMNIRGLNKTGTVFIGGNGQHWGQLKGGVGGFAGMSGDNSTIFNATIDGSASSKMFAITETYASDNSNAVNSTDYSEQYPDFENIHVVAGGIVGILTLDGSYNAYASSVGAGSIDGVIYNWKGVTYSTIMHGKDGTGANHRTKVDYIIDGGNCVGVANGKESNIKNLYYTFDINNFLPSKTGAVNWVDASGNFISDTSSYTSGVVYSGNNTNSVVINVKYNGNAKAKVFNLRRDKNNNNLINNVYIFQYARPQAVGVNFNNPSNNSDRVAEQTTGENSALTSQIKVVHVYEHNDPNNTVQNDGINMAKYDQAGADIGVSNQPNKNIIYSNAKITTQAVTSGVGYYEKTDFTNMLSWKSESKGSNIMVKFTASNSDPSQIIWSVYMTNVTTDANSNIIDAKGTITKKPMYATVRSLADAQKNKEFSYELLRGQGSNMSIYYNYGKALTLKPDESNFREINTHIYMSDKPLMYNAVDDASSVAMQVYDINGNAQNWSNADLTAIIKDAGDSVTGAIQRTVYKTTNPSWNSTTGDKSSWSNSISEGETLKDPGQYKVNYEIKGSEINYNAFVYENKRSMIFPQEEQDQKEANETLDTYTIYIAIVPVRLKISSITKVYDGSNQLFNPNQSTIAATVDTDNIYKSGIYTCTSSTGGITIKVQSNELDAGTEFALQLKGSYATANVSPENSAFIDLNSTTIKFLDLNRDKSGNAIKGENYYSVSSTNYSSYLFGGSKTCSPYEGYSKTFVENAIVNNNTLKLVNNEQLPWATSNKRTIQITKKKLIDPNQILSFKNNVVEYGSRLDFSEEYLKSLISNKVGIETSGLITLEDLKKFKYSTTVTPQSDVTDAAGIKYTITINAVDSNYAFVINNTAVESADLTATYIIYPKIISVTSATKTYDGEDTIGEIVFSGTISSAVINPIVNYNNSTSGNNKTLLFEVTTYSYVNTQGTTITLNRLKENGSATTGNSLSTNYCIASESVTNQKYEIKQFEITKDNTSFVWNFSNNSLNGASFEYNPNKTYSLSDLTGTVSINGTTKTKKVDNITYTLYPNPASNDITATIVIKQDSNIISSAQNAGTYTITVTFSGTNYTSKAIEIGSFEITKQIVTAEKVTITMDPYSNTYGNTGFNSPTTLGNSTIVIKDKYTAANVANTLHVSSVVYGGNKQATITANNGVYIGGYSVWATALTGNVTDATNYDIRGIMTLSNHSINEGRDTYFILPRQLTILNVLKTFDNTDSATNALYAVENLASGDSIAAMNATYSGVVNVGKEITVTFTFDSTPTILNTKYNVVLNNYCLASALYNVGTIIPKTITINNIYKEFDNTKEVNYPTSTVLVKDGSSLLSLQPDGAYTNKNVGKCDFIPETDKFEYYTVSGNALGEKTTVYRIKQSNTPTNYMVETDDRAIEGIAYITPKAITIISVHKEYNENDSFTGATFKISGFLGDITEATAFNGSYIDPNVKYDGKIYNDIRLELTPTQVVLGETTTTVYSIKSGDNINYTIDKASGNSVDIVGVGVIIPAVATISEIHKEYNSKDTFSTDFAENAKDYAIVSYIGNNNVDTRTKRFVISGTLSGKDAGTNYNATIDTVTFSFGGVTYNWLYTASDASNIANNYCIASTTINTIGEIYQYNIKLDPSTSGIVDGYLTNFRFKNSKDNKYYLVNKNTSGPEYRSSVTYSVSNFYADFKLGDDSGNISAGVLTINGTSISGAVTLNRSGIAFNAKDAGTWDAITLTINTSSLTNYTFTGNTTFSFTILKQNVTAANVTITGVNDYSRVYNGTNSVSGVTISGSLKGQFTDLDNNKIDISSGLSTSKISITSSTLSSANVGNYTVTSQYRFSSALDVASNGNYNYVIKTGTTTKVYKSGTTSPTYNIAAKDVSLSGTYTKDFDGSNIIEIKIDDLKEILKISVDFAGQGYLAGVYTGTPTASIKSIDTTLATNKNSTASNYKLNTSSITLTINKVNNLVIERQVKDVATGTFQIAIALSKLSSLDYLTKVSEITLTEISDALLYISDNSKGTEEAYNKLKQAISDSFMLKVNDTPDYAHYLEVGQIESIKVTKQNITLEDGREIELQILEVIYNGYSVLDNETLTDRYEIYMVGCRDNNGTMEVSSALANASTNVSISSSELENGQYNGASNTTGISISTAAELLDFLKGTATNGYLVNNIYNFNATTLEGKTNSVDGITFASGRVLDGNGYVIQLNNGFNETTNYAGLFIAENSGTIKNVVFNVGTNATTTKSQVGLVFGNNAGTIENVLVSIESEIADRGTSYIAGVSYNNSGSITLTTVAINANVNDLVGFVHTNTGTMNYISSRVKKGVTLDSSYLIAHTAGTIAYASVDSANTLYNSGTITKIYGNNNTALSPLQNKYSDNGFVDYYFTSSNKYKTGAALHNNENGTELNMTHYYGTASANTQIAIEVIAPLNRFIWEAFDAIAYKDGVVSKGVQINRAVGLFALEDDLVSKNSDLTFTTKVKVENTDKYASIFNPVFGAKTETVISQGTQDNIYEYTGSQITVNYTVGGEKMSITGTEVGVYRTLTKEAGGSAVIGDSYDTQNQEAHVVEGDSGTSTATVELIIVPKILSQGTLTNTKVYDSTSIAETLVDTDNKSGNDSYITGTFTSDGTTATKDVNTGLTVNYNMLTRKVAAVQNGDVYTFVTKKVTNIDGTYEFENINVDGVPFTNNTNISTLNKETLAKAFAKLIDYDKLTEAERKIYTAVDVYDLIITHTLDENTHAVTYSSSQVYFAVSLFNLDGTLNKNYQYMSSTLFNVTSIKATETVKAVASVVNGSITARELQATYNDNDLNQSYRDELVAPKATITQVTLDNLSNLPLSMTNAEKDALVAEINSAIVDTVTVDLSAYKDIDTYTVVDMLGGTATVKVLANENYIATNNYTATVQAENKKLTLRYFRSEVKENGEVWFKIESLEDIKAIGKEEAGADYTTLKYFVTKNINAKSAVLNQVNITFEGILDGNGKTISNFVLIGETSTGIFNTLSESAQVINLTFADVLIYTTGANATIEVVADTNNGTIDNIKLEGSFVSNGTVTVNGITNTNNDTNSAYVLQTGMNTGITFAGTTNNEVVILRDFGSTSFSVYINNAVSAISNVSDSVTTLIKSHVLDKLQLAVSDSGVVTISSFRQYWAYINICPWLTPSTNIYSIGMRN